MNIQCACVCIRYLCSTKKKIKICTGTVFKRKRPATLGILSVFGTLYIYTPHGCVCVHTIPMFYKKRSQLCTDTVFTKKNLFAHIFIVAYNMHIHYACVCMGVYVWVYACMRVRVYACMCVCVYVCICVCVYVCMSV